MLDKRFEQTDVDEKVQLALRLVPFGHAELGLDFRKGYAPSFSCHDALRIPSISHKIIQPCRNRDHYRLEAKTRLLFGNGGGIMIMNGAKSRDT